MRNKNILVIAILFSCVAAVKTNAAKVKRCRGDGLWFCEGAGTVGYKNLWLSGFGNAFIWDNAADSGAKDDPLKNFYAFPHLGVKYGVLDYLQAEANILG
ncbi:MAG: hypothetical protein ABIA63_01600, partial [bacterium]